MKLQESGEMYLETILVLSQKSDFVRAIDICEEMHYSKPSVSRAMKLLKTDGYIDISTEGHISLTGKGEEAAARIYERHKVLSEYFIGIGVSPEVAVEDACRIEHVISDETFSAIKKRLGI